MQPKKSLGQHFLTSSHIVDDIVRAGQVTKRDTVLEIGPGRGILTTGLVKTGANVVAVEKDESLIAVLEEKFQKEITGGKLHLIHADILETDISQIIPQSDTSTYKVVANIPYYITGQIIRMFLEATHQPQSMTVLIQKEVALRIIGGITSIDGKESLLSLSVKVYGTPTLIRRVSRGSFNPPPNVDSAVLHIENISRANFIDVDEQTFFTILHLGFAHKRKQLLPNLSTRYEKDRLSAVFAELGLDLQCRAEDIALQTWLALTQKLIV